MRGEDEEGGAGEADGSGEVRLGGGGVVPQWDRNCLKCSKAVGMADLEEIRGADG